MKNYYNTIYNRLMSQTEFQPLRDVLLSIQNNQINNDILQNTYKEIKNFFEKIPQIASSTEDGKIKLEKTSWYFHGFHVSISPNYSGLNMFIEIISAPVELKTNDWVSNFYAATFWFPVELFKIGIPKSYKKYKEILKLMQL